MTNLLATELQQLRHDSLLKQYQVAELAGITPPTYSRYEKGSHLPERHQVVRLAEVFHSDERKLRSLWLTDKIHRMLNEESDIADKVRRQL